MGKPENQVIVGMGGYGYNLHKGDRVYAVPEDNLEGAFSFKVGYVRAGTGWLGLMFDMELQVGTVDRGFREVPTPNTAWGGQFFTGPQVRWGRLSLHGLGGVALLHIEGADDIRDRGSSNVRFVSAAGGFSERWATFINEIESGRSPVVIPGYPSYRRRSLAANFGFGFDIVRHLRLLVEFVPVYDGRVHRDFRASLNFSSS